MRSIVAVIPLLMTCAVQAEPADSEGDRYGHMHMLLEKTWFGIDVANVDVWVRGPTRDALRRLASGQRYSDDLAERIARTAVQAPEASVQVELLRDASLERFLDTVRDNLVHARDAGYISGETFSSAWQGVRTDFGTLQARGLRKGDRIIYRAGDGALQTVVVAADDRVLLDATTREPAARTAMLAGYFAPKTDCRKGLIKSLF